MEQQIERKGFRVSIVARLKHGDLQKALKERGWSQKRAAEFLGMSQTWFGALINLRVAPKYLTRRQEKRLLTLTGKLPEDLWPEFVRSQGFLDMPKVMELTREITPLMLEAHGLLQLTPGPEEALEAKELSELLKETLASLTPRERRVIESRFFDRKTLKEVGTEEGVGGTRIGQIEQRALRRLRRPSRSKRLRQFGL